MESVKRKAASEEITTLADHLTGLAAVNGSDLITLVVSCRYAERLLTNQRIRRYLEKKWPEILMDWENLVHEVPR